MATAVQLQPGTIFALDFRIEAPLRSGGMGAVYAAMQLSTGTPRAIKVMLPSFAADEASRRRFEQEARVGARIPSEHVVQVIAAGVDAHTGAPWLAMELLHGEELADRVRRAGPLDPGEVRELFKQLGHAIGAAHRAGVVHRDLKPENLFLALPRSAGSAPFTLKVLDFGIAKITTEAIAANTGAIGTPVWMAPEQTGPGHDISPATDVWALGLIAYYVLTGRVFWRAASDSSRSMAMLLREMLVEPIGSARERATEQGGAHLLPPAFDRWFSRCVARDPAARFGSIDEAVAQLDAALRVERPRPPSDPPPRRNDRPSGVPGGKVLPWLAAAAGAGAIAIAVTVAFALRSGPLVEARAPPASDPRAALGAGALEWDDLVLPQWSGTDDPCDTTGEAVVITPKWVLAGDPPLRLFAVGGDRALGAPASAKRFGASDSFLVPLGRALRGGRRVLFIVDAATPYRLLSESVTTAVQSDATRLDFAVAHDGRPRTFAIYPRASGEGRAGGRSLMVLVMADHFEAYERRAVDGGPGAWTPLAPRCDVTTATPVPLRAAAQVAACLAAVAASGRDVVPVVSANADVVYGRVLVAAAEVQRAFGSVMLDPPL